MAWGGLLCAFALLLLLGPGRADAADQTYLHTGTFSGPGSDPGQLEDPRRAAVENSTGNVLVVDHGAGLVQVFAPDSSAATPLTEFGAGTLVEPFGIAVDQASGDVYVSDPGAGEVFKFSSDGAPTPTYTLDGTFTGPGAGGAAGQVGDFEADVAVAPDGDLLLADPGDNLVQRYEADGTFLSAFDGSGSPDGAFTGLLDIDVTADGDVLVVDATGPLLEEGEEPGGGGPGTCVQNYYCERSASRVLRFAADGSFEATLQPLEKRSAAYVAADRENGQVVVGWMKPGGRLIVLAADGRQIDEIFLPGFNWFRGIAIGGSTQHRLYTVIDGEYQTRYEQTVGEPGVQAFAATSLPEAAIDPVGAVTATSAHLGGSVNPNGNPTTWRFQYRLAGSEAWIEGAGGDAGEGTSPVAVAGDLADLEPNSSYEVRLSATGVAGKSTVSAIVTFTTGLDAPFVSTRFAAPRTTTTARINGYVNPRNDETTYQFEWGPTLSYGNVAPAAEDSAGSGGGQVLVAEQLSGLEPNTTYHYRLVAENSFGRVEGEDRTFTTRTAAEMVPPERGIELVNSPDKGNQNASGFLLNDSERVLWTTMTGSPGSPQGRGSIFLAERTESGWKSHSLLPKPSELIGGGQLGYNLMGASDDYSKVIYRIGEDANFGIEGDPFIFARYDVTTGEQEELDFFPKGVSHIDNQDVMYFVSKDGDHVYTSIREAPEPGSAIQIYDIGSGDRRLISVLPETGEPPACGITFDRQTPVMSKDGRRFYFLTRGDDCSGPLRIYLSDTQGTSSPADDTVTLVTTPPVSGPEGESRPVAVSASGGALLYWSAGRITAEDANEAPDIYRWSPTGGNECVTCIVPDPGLQVSPYNWIDNVVVSRDLSHVYISTKKRLVPELGRGSEENAYVFADGEVRYVSVADSGIGESWRDTAEVTPDGSVLTFVSYVDGITADDNGGLRQAYRYAEGDGSVECLSCVPGGVTTDAIATPPTRPFAVFIWPPVGAEARGLSEDGSHYAFLTDTAIVPEDANGGPDIYEWHEGTVQLVTDGEGEYTSGFAPLRLAGITKDGTDILFGVAARLTGHEQDEVSQLFVSRIGGGFPPPQPPAECAEDACQGPLEAPPGFAPPGSAGLHGDGQAREPRKGDKPKKCKPPARRGKAAKGKARCGKRAGKKGKGRAGDRNGGGK